MVEAGWARVSPAAPASACAEQLLGRERLARKAKAGLWAKPRFEVLPAWATRKLRRRENTFQIVEGKVVDVVETKRFTFLNFGTDWRRDFTLNVSAGARKRFMANNFLLGPLKGKTVRARGWIGYANGPMMRITTAGQIENLTDRRK